MNWIDTNKRLPNGHNENRKEEIEVIGYNEAWIHPDFNPNGTRVCVYYEGIWHSARWNGSHDCFIDDCSEDDTKKNLIPTHWMPSPIPPHNQFSSNMDESLYELTERKLFLKSVNSENLITFSEIEATPEQMGIWGEIIGLDTDEVINYLKGKLHANLCLTESASTTREDQPDIQYFFDLGIQAADSGMTLEENKL